MVEEKLEVTHQEQVPHVEADDHLATEDEPAFIYHAVWRTVMAIFALSTSNNCAAIANTGPIYHSKEAQAFF